MTRTLLIAGTASHVGKSTVAAGLCRLLADRGVAVAPFKAQNMSNNARVVVRPGATVADGRADDGGRGSAAGRPSEGGDRRAGDGGGGTADVTVGTDDGIDRPDRPESGDEWGEIGVSQFVQARAAHVTPTTDCNPVLLKPRGDGESQLILQGRAVDHLSAGEYYDGHWDRARAAAVDSYERLAAEADVVIAEGAGSIAEINLHDRDLANVELARFADADVLLLVDIERGGAFASLYGTLELLPADLRDRVAGAVITKFRGDASLLDPGIDEIESRTGVPILGVVPYADPGLPEEDSVGLPDASGGGVRGANDGVPDDCTVTVAVPRFPRISNATDLEALAAVPGVRIAYVPVGGGRNPAEPATDVDVSGVATGDVDASGDGTATRDPLSAVGADAVVLPGTKNTVDDLLAIREAGLVDGLRAFDGPIVGICGGYQMLGERITNAALEGTGERDVVEGVGRLPVETRFGRVKHVERTTVAVDGAGPIAGASGTASGYEIHAGETTPLDSVERPIGPTSAVRGAVLGTYLHGVFDNAFVREAFVERVFERAGVDRPGRESGSGAEGGVGSDSDGDCGADSHASPNSEGDGATVDSRLSPYDRAARLVADHVDLEPLGPPFE